MAVNEISIEVRSTFLGATGVESCAQILSAGLTDGQNVLRFVISQSAESSFTLEAAVLSGFELPRSWMDTFQLIRRPFEDSSSFNVALVIPTGIGAEIGGHAGDAGPVAILLSSICDSLITHPNVVNGSDINEIPNNALYVEGSLLTRLLLGNIGFHQVRSNRVLAVIQQHEDRYFTNSAINSVNAARSTYGLRCREMILLKDSPQLQTAYSGSGRACGMVTNLEPLFQILEKRRGEYDAVAISSVIEVPTSYHREYFAAVGEMVNPWGGIEAMLTHAISSVFDIPSAHSPMFECREIADSDPGIVDPRMSAEAVSLTFIQSVLKGLHKSPRVVLNPQLGSFSGIDVTKISCLVIPDGCIGIPTLAALAQGIPVIAVRENRNIMRNDLRMLAWRPGQLRVVGNYWEAAGVLASMRCGIDPDSTRRPIDLGRTSAV